MRRLFSESIWLAATSAVILACSGHQSDDQPSSNGLGGSSSGATHVGGFNSGGATASGGATLSGGRSTSPSTTGGAATGGAATGGETSTGGMFFNGPGGAATGGVPAVVSGGAGALGGIGTGGSVNATAGGTTTGGAKTGGTSSATGGVVNTTGGSTAYSPCPALSAPCKIMPSGDSITVGAQSTDTGGYRAPLFHTTLVNKQNVTFVGPSGAGPDTVDGIAFPQSHDGHSGYIIDTVGTRKGLSPLMEQNLATYAPHIVLLMIGTNDINSQVDVANAPTRLAALIDKVSTFAPNALLVVAQITPNLTDSLNASVQTFNAAIPAIVSERAKAGKHILLVDMYGAFTANASYKTSLMFDGLHPNDAGYAVMANVWYRAIGGFLH